MPADHDEELHAWAGAYALGALDPHDRRRFERHLAECVPCASEVRSFAPIPGLLAQLDADDLDATIRPETADAISRQVRHEARQLRTSRNRWRVAAIAAVAAVVVIVAAAVVTDGGPASDPSVAAAITSSLAESTDVTTTGRGWGTQIDLALTGLPSRARYQLWAVDDAGEWSVAATWGPTPSGRATITGATATPMNRLGRVVVTSDDPDDIIVDATT
jgi:anti-sigma-K factor RskA